MEDPKSPIIDFYFHVGYIVDTFHIIAIYLKNRLICIFIEG